MADKEIKVQIDRRQDGRFSVTVKLIAWDLNYLRGLIQQMYMTVSGRAIARELAAGLEDDLREIRDRERAERHQAKLDTLEAQEKDAKARASAEEEDDDDD